MATKQKRKRVCRFTENRISIIDYKDEKLLRRFINERGKIIPRRVSGNCAQAQRTLVQAVKRARILALLPFTATHMMNK